MKFTPEQVERARKIFEEEPRQFAGFVSLDGNNERRGVHVVVTCTPKDFLEFHSMLETVMPWLTDEILPVQSVDNPHWGWNIPDICQNLFEFHPEQTDGK